MLDVLTETFGDLPLPPAVILSGAGGKIAFSDLVEGSPNIKQKRL